MAYAVAAVAGEPLLAIGNDFAHTDLEVRWRRGRSLAVLTEQLSGGSSPCPVELSAPPHRRISGGSSPCLVELSAPHRRISGGSSPSLRWGASNSDSDQKRVLPHG